MKIALVGPNIMQKGGGSTGFHIHKPGCKDLRQPKYSMAEKEIIEAASLEEVTRYVYSDHIAESADPSDIGSYLADFTIFPCVEGLK